MIRISENPPRLAGWAFLFDMDGVLIDSNPYHRQAWLLYNRRFGIETSEAMQERMYGRHNDDIVRDFFGSGLCLEKAREHGAAKERLYRELVGSAVEEALVPGVRDFLERYRLPSALATNADPANVEFILDSTGLRSHFAAVVDGRQVERPKPHPDIFLRAAEMLGAAPGRCIVFEDSHSGVAAARAAEMRTVGVRTTHAELPGVDLGITDFRDPALERWLAALEGAR